MRNSYTYYTVDTAYTLRVFIILTAVFIAAIKSNSVYPSFSKLSEYIYT